MRFPIGQPTHCEPSIPKSNRTIPDVPQILCPSFCVAVTGHETPKLNQVSDTPEVHEIPENADIIETSTTFKVQKVATTKLLPVERKIELSEPSTTLGENVNHTSVEQTTPKETIESSSPAPLIADDQITNKVNKIAVQAEQPIEVRDSAIIVPNTPSPILPTNFSEKIEINPDDRTVDIIDVQKKQNKPKELLDTNTEFKQQEIEPSDEHGRAPKFLENDIKSTFNKKSENKFERALPDVELPKPSNADPLTPFTQSSQVIASTPTYGIVEASNPACLSIYLLIRSESFNMTLGFDEICHNFNITYNIPLSKYMKENRFELVFV